MSAPPVAASARHSTAQASLAILGITLRQLDRFGPVRGEVRVAQKTVRHRPADKRYDVCIALLTGAQGLAEINRRVRADPALPLACGRAGCAEQSVVQGTLDGADVERAAPMERALDHIDRAHSRGYRDDDAQAWQLLDADVSGLPCGKQATLATTGSCAKQRRRWGRQLGRVRATADHEVVVDRLFAGNTLVRAPLPTLVLAAEGALELDESRR